MSHGFILRKEICRKHVKAALTFRDLFQDESVCSSSYIMLLFKAICQQTVASIIQGLTTYLISSDTIQINLCCQITHEQVRDSRNPYILGALRVHFPEHLRKHAVTSMLIILTTQNGWNISSSQLDYFKIIGPIHQRIRSRAPAKSHKRRWSWLFLWI